MPRIIKPKAANGNGHAFSSQQSLASYIWDTCDILRRSNCVSPLQYVPELTWILFLRILDEREELEAANAEAVGQPYTPSLEAPYRWRDWAAPGGHRRIELQMGPMGGLFAFVNGELLPELRRLKERLGASPRQKVISEIMSGVERVCVDSEKNFYDVLDRVHQISIEELDRHPNVSLSQVYDELLRKLGEQGNGGGQFFTPREVIRVMVEVINPKLSDTVYDPSAGTGGFLVQAYEHMRARLGDEATTDQLDALSHRTFFGREKENLIYPIALANMVLHGIDQPNLWHGNTLTGGVTYGGLFADAPPQFSVILSNPPFGGKEGKEAQTNFAYKTSATQVLFLQHIIDSLAPKGRCAIVLDEGVLFRTNETAFVQTKRKLLDDCDLWCIVSLPPGVFAAVGAGVKTNILFFTKGGPTERIWYYDLSDLKVTRRMPLTFQHLTQFWTFAKSLGG